MASSLRLTTASRFYEAALGRRDVDIDDKTTTNCLRVTSLERPHTEPFVDMAMGRVLLALSSETRLTDADGGCRFAKRFTTLRKADGTR